MSDINVLVEKYYLYLKERDRDNLLGLLSENIVVTYHGQAEQLPWAGQFHGIAGFDEFFTIIKDHLNVIDVSIIHRTADENRVINQCEGIWEYKKSGVVVKGSMVNVFTVDLGKITGYDVYADTAAFLAGFSNTRPLHDPV